MGKGDGLFKRGSRWWLRTDPVTGKPVSTGSSDKTAALSFQRRRQREAADPAHAAAASATFEQWALRLVNLKRSTKADGTASMYEQKLGHMLRIGRPDGKRLRMSDITPGWVDAYFEQRREEGAAEQTLARELTAISQVCKLAQRSKQFSGDVKMLRPPGFSPEYVAKERWLPPVELAALLAELPPMKAAHVAFIVATGARRGEGDRAQLSDVDMERGVVKLRGTKTVLSAREVPIMDVMRPLIEGAIHWLPLGPWNNQLRDLSRACKRAGIARVSWNDLRRTTATWLIGAGVAHELVAKILGHATPTMVYRVYGRATAETIGSLAQSQIDSATRSRQARALNSGKASGPIAQTAELRIFNPKPAPERPSQEAGYAAAIAIVRSPETAEVRGATDNIVTVGKTPTQEVCEELLALKAMAAELACESAESAIERALAKFEEPDLSPYPPVAHPAEAWS